MTLTIRDNEFYGAQLNVADIIAGYGNSQGAGHVWTPDEWLAAKNTGKVRHLIVFWGAGADDAVNQARAVGATCVWMDIEGQFTQQAIASGRPQAFGDRCRALGFPCAVYGTDALCDAVGGHYDGTVRYRTGAPGTVAPRTAYQYIHAQSYDESIAADDFPGGPNMAMTAQEVSGVLKLAYGLGGITDADNPNSPYSGEFNAHVNEVVTAAHDLHWVINEIESAHPWGQGQAPQGTPGQVTVSGLNLKVTGP